MFDVADDDQVNTVGVALFSVSGADEQSQQVFSLGRFFRFVAGRKGLIVTFADEPGIGILNLFDGQNGITIRRVLDDAVEANDVRAIDFFAKAVGQNGADAQTQNQCQGNDGEKFLHHLVPPVTSFLFRSRFPGSCCGTVGSRDRER